MPESQYSIVSTISVGEMNASFATWNSSTPLNTTATIVSNDISYNTLNITLAQTTTITGGVVTFQGSTDGVNWVNLQGFQVGTGATIGPTYTLQANTYVVFSFNLTALPYFQVLLSTVITGTGSVTIGYAADSVVNQPPSASASANPSVGPNGSPIPSDSTLIGTKDASGNLQPASVANPVPVVIEPTSGTGNTPTNITISTASVTVLAANANRKGANVVNISFGTVSLAFGGASAVAFTGVTLGPGGTFWMDHLDFTTAAIQAISTQGNTTIAVQEFV